MLPAVQGQRAAPQVNYRSARAAAQHHADSPSMSAGSFRAFLLLLISKYLRETRSDSRWTVITHSLGREGCTTRVDESIRKG